MGTSLTGLTPATTYDALIKVGDNGPLSATAKVLSDGLGNDSPLAMSTSAVGIDTATPARPLTIRSSQANATATTYTGALLIHDEPSGTSPHLGIGVSYDGGNEHSWIQSNNTSGAYALAINPAGGNVGIGTSTPGEKLTVNGTVGFQQSGTQTYHIAPVSGNLIFVQSGIKEIMSVTPNGITFNGDTAAANALDDYEEGTWTPVFAGETTAGTYTYLLGGGGYRKIGSQVTVWCSLVDVAQSVAGSGSILISGLPFTVANSDIFARASCPIYVRQALATRNNLIAIVPQNNNKVYLQYDNNASSGGSAMTIAADYAAGMDIGFSVTYFV